ncbi:MAG: SUMF1/EgtB/PvdO family nonheme iron enzyme [Planctomycetota bacterium]
MAITGDDERQESRSTEPPPGDGGTGLPSHIGPYKIVRPVGEGGMGTVYLATQEAPVRRQVALKVVKLGMDTKAVLRRFEIERQSLALMSHDNIARVYDVGTTDRGQPYFAMEYVQGVPIDVYCDRYRTSLTERIRLFQLVCAGVQHAHQKGIVHRDLKPSNVLISEEQGQAVPKIIDFGLARATDPLAFAQTMITEVGQLIGTPEYMAPEQIDPTVADVDTRADVYSLGVLLYQLLIGELPFPRESLMEHGFAEMQRIVRETDPPRPSTRLLSAGSAEEAAAQRRTTRGALTRALRSDLDWVVLKAMEKDRHRRYATVNGLAEDLQRYLSHEPLLAGPPSAIYRLRKLGRRYRGALVAGSLVVLSLVAGLIAFAVANERATESERVATERAVQIAEQSEEILEQRNELAARNEQFATLAAHARLEDVTSSTESLFPAWPNKLEELRQWIEGDAEVVVSALPILRSTVDELRERAIPIDEDALASERLALPETEELSRARQQLELFELAGAVFREEAYPPKSEVPDVLQQANARALNAYAVPRVCYEDRKRVSYDEVPEALAAAQLAIERIDEGDDSLPRYWAMVSEAWAMMNLGECETALAMCDAAIELAPPIDAADLQVDRQWMESEWARFRGPVHEIRIQREQRRIAELEETIAAYRTWEFEDPADEFLHSTLVETIEGIEDFRSGLYFDVTQRERWAASIGRLTSDHPNARVTWEEARESIWNADGRSASESYGAGTLDLEPQVGLVPIGMNPVTGLWEFYHLRSAWDPHGEASPEDLPIPDHAEDGSIDVRPETGIVFVLLPGATFTMGAQSDDENDPNYENEVDTDEAIHEVSLEPFFMARHELTQGQWMRLGAGDEPSQYGYGFQNRGVDRSVERNHPVESIQWSEANDLLHRHRLLIPTEAQWEYGCRAGTSTAYFTGPQIPSLQGYCNLLDERAIAHTSWIGSSVPWDDGYVVHAPVGTFKANPFGLHDAVGNVREWCRDWHGRYELDVDPGDGMRSVRDEGGYGRVVRGGSFMNDTWAARSAERNLIVPTAIEGDRGVRASRAVLSAAE